MKSVSGLLVAALLCAVSALPAVGLRAETVTVAVAANFKTVMDQLEPLFEEASGHDLRVSSGSTGKLYAQIMQGAPFDLLLAADELRPALLVEEGLAKDEHRFTYAIGRLALWTALSRYDEDDLLIEALGRGDFRRLAIANPELAPYGLAAEEALTALKLWGQFQDRIVRGQNIGQTFAMVATGNAELGFVALASLMEPDYREQGRAWEVPQELHEPIRQDAVLLRSAEDNEAALAFLAFLMSEEARKIIRSYGYRTD